MSADKYPSIFLRQMEAIVYITCFLDKAHLGVLHSRVHKSQAYLKQTFMIPIARYKDNEFKGKVSVKNSYRLDI